MRIVLAAAALVTLLAGCSAPVAPTPSPTAAPSVTATATPEPDPAVVVTIRSTGLEVSEDGTPVASRGWFDDAPGTIALLTDVFGSDPVPVPYEGHIEAQPGTDYTWSGFTFRVQDFEAIAPDHSNLSIQSAVSQVGDVQITTAEGFTVGSTLAEVQAVEAVSINEYEIDGHALAWYRFDPVQIGESMGSPLIDMVGLRVDLEAAVVIEIWAPAKNYGV